MIASGNAGHIQQVLLSFTRENSRLITALHQILYYHRGALTRDDVWAMSPLEREEAVEFLNKRFEDGGKLMKNGVSVFL